jgi:pilus assembly protein Flp/PilA
MGSLIARFVRDEEGQDLIEYALVGGLVAVAAVTAIGLIGTNINRVFVAIKDKLVGVTVPN